MSYDSVKRWRKNNPEKRKEQGRSRHKRVGSRLNAEHRKRYAECPEFKFKKRQQAWLRLYGITKEQYYSLLSKQAGRCAICGKTPEELGQEMLCVDHVHESNPIIIRGLLCKADNLVLGMVKDNISRLTKAIDYLEEGME